MADSSGAASQISRGRAVPRRPARRGGEPVADRQALGEAQLLEPAHVRLPRRGVPAGQLGELGCAALRPCLDQAQRLDRPRPAGASVDAVEAGEHRGELVGVQERLAQRRAWIGPAVGDLDPVDRAVGIGLRGAGAPGRPLAQQIVAQGVAIRIAGAPRLLVIDVGGLDHVHGDDGELPDLRALPPTGAHGGPPPAAEHEVDLAGADPLQHGQRQQHRPIVARVHERCRPGGWVHWAPGGWPRGAGGPPGPDRHPHGASRSQPGATSEISAT